jgi:hypothetical protein
MEDKMIEIFSANDMYKINIMQEMLAEANIESTMLDQKGSSLLLGEIHLYVDQKDETKALEIIKKHKM